MNGCNAMQARFTEYLDGRLNGHEMQRIAAHLEDCRSVRRRVGSLRQAQSSLAALGPVPEPPRPAVADSRGHQPGAGAQPPEPLPYLESGLEKHGGSVSCCRPRRAFASAVLLLGTVIVLVTMFTQPESAQANKDEPLGNPPRLGCSISPAEWAATRSAPFPARWWWRPISTAQRGPPVYDYRIVSGPTDQETRSQVENLLLSALSRPASSASRCAAWHVLSFSGVSVRMDKQV
jgi:hypothetical protein